VPSVINLWNALESTAPSYVEGGIGFKVVFPFLCDLRCLFAVFRDFLDLRFLLPSVDEEESEEVVSEESESLSDDDDDEDDGDEPSGSP